MTVSVGDSFIIALIIVVCLGAFIGITLIASRRPYFKHPKPEDSPTGMSGGIHTGDPRSMSPHGPVPAETDQADEPAGQEETAEQRRSG